VADLFQEAAAAAEAEAQFHQVHLVVAHLQGAEAHHPAAEDNFRKVIIMLIPGSF
jgi:hypothetical protein